MEESHPSLKGLIDIICDQFSKLDNCTVNCRFFFSEFSSTNRVLALTVSLTVALTVSLTVLALTVSLTALSIQEVQSIIILFKLQKYENSTSVIQINGSDILLWQASTSVKGILIKISMIFNHKSFIFFAEEKIIHVSFSILYFFILLFISNGK